jgi:hypothetical protein
MVDRPINNKNLGKTRPISPKFQTSDFNRAYDQKFANSSASRVTIFAELQKREAVSPGPACYQPPTTHKAFY